jgi:hypothetical protein
MIPMQGPQGLTPEVREAASQRWVHVIVKNDARQVMGAFDDTLLHVAAMDPLPVGWALDITNIESEAQCIRAGRHHTL